MRRKCCWWRQRRRSWFSLDTIDVSGGGRSSPSDAPLSNALAPTPRGYLARAPLSRFSRIESGRYLPWYAGRDVRRGTQRCGLDRCEYPRYAGRGRVAVTIDGAENGFTSLSRLSGDIEPHLRRSGPAGGRRYPQGRRMQVLRGIAGTVAMRTLSADDVVKP